jgi:hypothetical protein
MVKLWRRTLACQASMALWKAPSTEPGTSSKAWRRGTAEEGREGGREGGRGEREV